MTPFAQVVLQAAISAAPSPIGCTTKEGSKARSVVLHNFQTALCFETSQLTGSVIDLLEMAIVRKDDEKCRWELEGHWLPAPITWLEWRLGRQRFGIGLEAKNRYEAFYYLCRDTLENSIEIAFAECAYPLRPPFDDKWRNSGLKLVEEQFKDEPTGQAPGLRVEYELLARLFLIRQALRNQRAFGTYRYRAPMERALRNLPYMTRRHQIDDIEITIDANCDSARKKAMQRAGRVQAAPRAWHQVISHTRICASGKVTIVRAHHRGDISVGMRTRHYRVIDSSKNVN